MSEGTSENYKVYKHTLPMDVSGKQNDMVYIGITSKKDVKQRWLNGSGYKKQDYFYNAIKKYGWDNFKHVVLFNGLTKQEAEQKEIELIAKYNSSNRLFGYNRTNGGNCIGTVLQETKDKISKANIGNQYSLGFKQSIETRKRKSIAMMGNQNGKGQKLSDEHKRILAESHKTKEFRRKISKSNTGKRHSEETKRKLSETHKGLGAKMVRCVETGAVYNSIKDAHKETGACHIVDCCKGNRQSAGGYHWEYYKEVA